LQKHSGVVNQHIESVIPLLELCDCGVNGLLHREIHEQQINSCRRICRPNQSLRSFAALLVTTSQDDGRMQLC
jgi:hypothetical protein